MKFRCVANLIGNPGGSFSRIASGNQIGRNIDADDDPLGTNDLSHAFAQKTRTTPDI
jgi:hypothetical protein